MPQRGDHDVYIIKVGDKYRIRPAHWSSDGQGGQSDLKFRNLTDNDVLILLPPAILQNASQGKVELVAARKGNAPGHKDVEKVVLKGKARDDPGGVYPYSVLVSTSDGWVKAEGESEPVIIIDPPA